MPAQVREPTDFYLSFYRWGVAFRQRENPKSFGANFLEWVEKVSVRLHAPHAHAHHMHNSSLLARTAVAITDVVPSAGRCPTCSRP